MTEQERRPRKPVKKLAILILMAVIFWVGMLVGQGKITLGEDTPQVATSGNLPDNLDYSSVEEVYDSLKTVFDGSLTETQLLDGIKKGLAGASGDPYTQYFNPEAAQEFNEDLNGSFTGIGAELGLEEDSIVVVAPIAGFPAEKAGLKSKDIIAEIDGQTTHGLTVEEAVKKIRGAADTKVTLTVIRGGSEKLTLEITRTQITIPSVKTEIINGVGYMLISRFAEDTAKLAQAGAESFKVANVTGVILDVRNDPGGLLDASVDVSSLWLDNKTVLQEKRGDTVVKTYKSKGNPVLNGIPTVMLINEGSASASEIVAGALKDNGAATLIGVKSYGKGSVQQINDLKSGGALKVTFARWYTPGGRNIDKEGIEPDKKVELDVNQLTVDLQKNAALEFLKK